MISLTVPVPWNDSSFHRQLNLRYSHSIEPKTIEVMKKKFFKQYLSTWKWKHENAL